MWAICCTIWDRRPVVCRELDCRIFLKLDPEELKSYLQRGMLHQNQIDAAQRLAARMEAPC